jgi:hypothetical protein
VRAFYGFLSSPGLEELLEGERIEKTVDVGSQDQQILRNTWNDLKIPNRYLSSKVEEVKDTQPS